MESRTISPEKRKDLEFVERERTLLESKGFLNGVRIEDKVEEFYDVGRFSSSCYRGIPIGGGYGNFSFDKSKIGTIPQDLVEIVENYRGEELSTEALRYENVKEAFNYPRSKGLMFWTHMGSLPTMVASLFCTIYNIDESNFGEAALWGTLCAGAAYGGCKSGVATIVARSEATRLHKERNKDSLSAFYSLRGRADSIDVAIYNYKNLVQSNKNTV